MTRGGLMGASCGAAEAEIRSRDVAIVNALTSGSEAALGELYDRHSSAMLGVALRILRERADAEDLVHDVFVEAWQRVSSYDPSRGTVRSWLLMRVRSRGIDRLRSLSVARRHAMAETLPRAAPPDPVWLSVDGGRARLALAELPAPQRELVELSYFEGYTCAEMAARCEIPIGTVKSRLSAAIGKLRKQLQVEGGSA